MSLKSVYPGSFDPFTFGHLDIVQQAAKLFDEVIILIANNSSKQRFSDKDSLIENLRKDLERHDLFNVTVDATDLLVADYCKKYEIDYLVRGLRNTTDYQYEENLAKVNSALNSSLKTIYLRADSKLEYCSSTFVRELIKHNKNIFDYVPHHVAHGLVAPIKKPYKLGVVCGRFQPLHNGHCSVIEKAIEQCEEVLVLVGSAQEFMTERNPLSYLERAKILHKVFGNLITVRPIDDLTDSSDVTGEWGRYFLDTIKAYTGRIPDAIYTGAEPVRTKWFYPEDLEGITEVTIDRDIIPVSSTEIRQLFLKNNRAAIKKVCPPGVMHYYDVICQVMRETQTSEEVTV